MTTLVGAGALTRLALRRDRILLPAWLAVLTVVPYASVAGTASIYPSESTRAAAATVIAANPAVVALYGPATDLATIGGLGMWKLTGFLGVLIALLSVIVVVRHTRADEEAGRTELVGSGVVGRHAPLAAAVTVATLTNVALSLLIAAGLALAPEVSAAGAIATGLAFGGVGLVFTGVAAVAAQLTASARTATGIAATAIGVLYALRAAGDTGGGLGALGWATPFGWAHRVRPFGDLSWAPLALFVLAAAALVACAFTLASRRDVGAGLLPQRPGPAIGSLRTAAGLAWRLQRGTLLGWAAGFALLGGVLGSIASSAGDIVGSSDFMRDYLASLGGSSAALTDAYLATSLGIVAVLATAYAMQAASRLRSEEAEHRLEPLLSTAVGRVPWALGHVVIAAAGSGALLLTAGAAAGLTHGARTGDVAGQFPRVLGAALAQLPAVWAVASIAILAYGVAPRLTAAGWAALVGFLLISELGPVLGLADEVLDVSPYSHVPRLPGGEFSAVPLVVLLAIAAALAAAGLAALRRRDLG